MLNPRKSLCATVLLTVCALPALGDGFESAWPRTAARTWVGPEYWANRLQDWRLADGRLECLAAQENRSVHLLTGELTGAAADFAMEVTVGIVAPAGVGPKGWVNFRIGVRGQFDDYRDSAIYGTGLNAGVTRQGGLFIDTPAHVDKNAIGVALRGAGVRLRLPGNNDLGFPNNDLVAHVTSKDPDLLFFSGDQIYERVAGFGTQTAPFDAACLDYLRKWYLVGWAYGDLMRSRPSVFTTDDHDVYHGNIWGEGGKAADGSVA